MRGQARRKVYKTLVATCNLRLNCTVLWAKSRPRQRVNNNLFSHVKSETKNRFLRTPNILIEHWAIGALQLRANHKVMAFSLFNLMKKVVQVRNSNTESSYRYNVKTKNSTTQRIRKHLKISQATSKWQQL